MRTAKQIVGDGVTIGRIAGMSDDAQDELALHAVIAALYRGIGSDAHDECRRLFARDSGDGLA